MSHVMRNAIVWSRAIVACLSLALVVAGLALVSGIGGDTGLRPSRELAERAAVKRTVATHFRASEFDALEALAERYRTHRERTRSGVWKLTLFYAALHEQMVATEPGDRAGWKAIGEKLRAWRERFPASPTPYIANAIALKRLAWNARPIGLVQEAAFSPQDRFVLALEATRSFLDEHEAIASRDPHFFVIWANVAGALGEETAEFLSRIEEGIEREPHYYQLYFAALEHFALGEDKQPAERAKGIEAFANLAASRLERPQGLALYARLYWYASSALFGERVFTETAPDWSRVREGIDDVLAEFPDDWNVNNFARLACLRGDREMTASLFARMRGAPAREVWRSGELLARCRALAGLRG